MLIVGILFLFFSVGEENSDPFKETKCSSDDTKDAKEDEKVAIVGSK